MINTKFKSFFYYFMPLMFLSMCIIPMYLLFEHPYFKNQLFFSIILLFFISIILIFIQALCLSIDAKNNNRILKIFPLFLLGYIYIPYYYSKYIEKEYSKLPIIKSFLSLIIIGISIYLGYNLKKKKKDLYYKVISDDKLLQVNFPKSFNKCSYSETYDLECYDETNNLTTMIVNYKLNEINYENKLVDIITSYVKILNEKDKTLEKIEEPSLTTINNKNIYQVVYKGTSDGIEYDFILSSIDYNDDDILSLVIQVVEVGNYKNNKEKLSNILSSIIKEKH